MCGFVGILNQSSHCSRENLKAMISTISHRGPDDTGYWADQKISLAHARLSIHDLSSYGSQPMLSHCGRFAIAFNGEIYNYETIKEKLQEKFGWVAKTSTDTEVLVNLFSYYSIDEALKQCHGMFAFALWDREQKTCYLARDRFGEKPLYYTLINGSLIFGSELKSLRKYDGWSPKLSSAAIEQYLRFSYIHQPLTIYEDCWKVEAGQYLAIDLHQNIKKFKYYDLATVAYDCKSNLMNIDLKEASDLVENKLSSVIKQQMSSDVPLGAFLSGGVDSSLICALMQKKEGRSIKTFSIGFSEDDYNEAPYAKAVAQHLGCSHTELYVGCKEAKDIILKMPEIYDEPFADTSQIPTFLVSKLAKNKVTVALTGDAGDEIFGGYNRYIQLNNKLLKSPFFKKVFRFLMLIRFFKLYKYASTMLPRKFVLPNFQNKVEKVSKIIDPNISLQEYYVILASKINHPFSFLNQDAYDNDYNSNADMLWEALDEFNDAEQLMMIDTIQYLQSNNLTKVDRAAMANSLETRAPFLDHEIFELAWRLPNQHKMLGNSGKVVLKNILYKYVPKQMIDRPKMGFGVPIKSWLQGELKAWAGSLLDPTCVKKHDILSVNSCSIVWKKFQKDGQSPEIIWNLLMLQAWLEEWS